MNHGPLLFVCNGYTLSYSVSADWDLKPRLILFVYRESIRHTKIKSILTAHTKTSQIRCPSNLRPVSKNQVNSDHTKSIDHFTKNESTSDRTQSISTPRIKKSISIPTLKPTNSAPLTKIKSTSTPSLRSSQFYPYSKIK